MSPWTSQLPHTPPGKAARQGRAPITCAFRGSSTCSFSVICPQCVCHSLGSLNLPGGLGIMVTRLPGQVRGELDPPLKRRQAPPVRAPGLGWQGPNPGVGPRSPGDPGEVTHHF